MTKRLASATEQFAGRAGKLRRGTVQLADRRWIVELDGRRVRIPNLVGMRYLSELLTRPGQLIPALTLASPGAASEPSSRQELLDDEARAAYAARARELTGDLAEAEANNDLMRAERLRVEMDALVDELESTTGLGGRSRRFTDAAERARSSVSKAIKRAIDAVDDASPAIADALRATVSCGVVCSYAPDPQAPVAWSTGQGETDAAAGPAAPVVDAPVPTGTIGELGQPRRGVGPSAGTTRSTSRAPLRPTRFFGRASETTELEKRLDDARLVTLVGPPGCGKSRLGVELASRLASRFAGGAYVVELAPLADPARTASVVGAILGITDRPDRSTMETLVEALVDQELLLILDNCEHLVTAVAEIASRLMEACGSLRILATSRVALGLAGEQVWNVAPLDPPVAVELFLDRARSVVSAFPADDASRRLTSDICERLDGLPLAIELAAASTRVLSPIEIVSRLDETLPLPRSGIRPAIPRHQTMEATMDWSYQLLGPGEQRLFDTLSVFAGGFDLPAAAAVAASDDDVLGGLTMLVDHSLVVAELESTEPMQYRMLEPVRQYAAAKLKGRGDHQLVRRRHADHYLEFARRAEAELLGDRPGVTLRRLSRDEGNFRVALEWARAQRSEVGLRLAAALAMFWELRGRVNEGRARLDEMLRIGSPDVRLCGSALARAGRLAWRQRDYAGARDFLQRSLDIACQLADPLVVARRRRSLALVSMTEGDAATATDLCVQSIAACRAHDDDIGLVWGLIFLGLTRYVARDLAAGSRHIHEALAVNRRVGSTRATAAAQLYLSWAASESGDIAAERAHVVGAFAAIRQLGGAVEPDWLYAGAALAAGEGRSHAALRLAGAAEALSRRTGSHLNEPFMASLEPLLDQARRHVGRRLADRLWAEGAQMALDDLMADAEALPADGADHPLTARETEVAELVGQGLTNVEIARQLYISRRTVESHVEHIKRKLGLSTRHQVIAWMLRETMGPRHPEGPDPDPEARASP